jgi:4-hydroxybenzoate polyprenyltransferase
VISLKKFFSLVKFSHTVFALPFALIGYFMAAIQHGLFFDTQIFILVILAMVFARNTAMAFNRYIDRHIDAQNPRTAVREIPKGIISISQVRWFIAVNAVLFIATAFFINRLVFFLSPVALTVILGYSYFKRFSALSHLILGLGLALAPIGAYLCIIPHFDTAPVLLSLVVLFWVAGFDIIYALQDEKFDKTHSLKSIPVLLGTRKSIFLSIGLHLLSVVLLVLLGFFATYGIWYWTGVFIFGSLLFYQHLLVKPNDLSKINLAFFTTNGIASVVFAGFVILDLFLG